MNILTFDLEDWFHFLDFHPTRFPPHWERHKSSVEKNTHIILSFLKENNLKATFFSIGWITQKHPELIKEIHNNGFDIGVHSHEHQLIFEQRRSDFKEDLEVSVKTLENLIGKKVRMYRAPGFSVDKRSPWFFELLHNYGIEIDGSVFPTKRIHGGYPAYPFYEPHLIKGNHFRIKEFPINTYQIYGRQLVFSGGGYFRLFPYFIIKYFSSLFSAFTSASLIKYLSFSTLFVLTASRNSS